MLILRKAIKQMMRFTFLKFKKLKAMKTYNIFVGIVYHKNPETKQQVFAQSFFTLAAVFIAKE